MTRSVRLRVAGLQPVQVLAGIVGLVFLVIGIVGLTRTGFTDFAGHSHGTLFGFALNPFHNLIHLVTGIAGLLMAITSATARLFGWILFVGYGLVLVWGLMIVGVFAVNPVSELGNPMNLNIADNWLHVGFMAVGLLVAVLPARRKVLITEPEPEPVAEPDRQPVTEQAYTEKITTEKATVDPVTEPVEAQKPEPTRGGLHRLRGHSAH